VPISAVLFILALNLISRYFLAPSAGLPLASFARPASVKAKVKPPPAAPISDSLTV